MSLSDLYQSLNAEVAPDGIPLRFGDLKDEYHAALHHAVLMDRSHEGRLIASGDDRFALIHRISTNDVTNMRDGEGRVTLFTNPNARIIDRAIVYNRGSEALLLGEPGRGAALLQYLQRNVFFNDKAKFRDISGETKLFALHGSQADAVMDTLVAGASALTSLHGMEAVIAGTACYIVRRKPLSDIHWNIVVPVDHAVEVWQAITAAGKAFNLQPAGSLTYNTIRIRAGYPAFGREVTTDFIPLEVGLWDDISFSKGCYTGQEIIARMESRNRLARTMVQLDLQSFVAAPADIFANGRRIGTLTSSVVSPDGESFALGVVKTQFAQLGIELTVGSDSVSARILKLAGVQPANVTPEELVES